MLGLKTNHVSKNGPGKRHLQQFDGVGCINIESKKLSTQIRMSHIIDIFLNGDALPRRFVILSPNKYHFHRSNTTAALFRSVCSTKRRNDRKTISTQRVLSSTWESNTWKDGLYIEVGPWWKGSAVMAFVCASLILLNVIYVLCITVL